MEAEPLLAPRRVQSLLSRRVRCAALLAIVLWAAVLRVEGMVGPFGSGWQHLGAFYSLMARNDLRYGVAETRLAQVVNAEPAPRDQWVFYTHHPPGMSLTTAAVASLIGEGPLAIKLHGLLFSLLEVVLIYLLVAAALSPGAGLAAAFIAAVVPAGAYFATHGSELGPQAIALALLALLMDERARKRAQESAPARPRSLATFAALCGSLFFAWPALGVAAFISGRDLLARNFRRALLFGALIPAALLVRLLHVRLATGHFDDGSGITLVASALGHSVVGASTLLVQFDALQVVRRVAGHLRFLFGDLGLAAAALGALLLALAFVRRRRRDDPVGPRAWTTAAGLATFALLYSLPFPRAVVVHRYYLIVALPMVAFLGGFAVHATSHLAIGRLAALAAAAAIGVTGSARVLHDHRADRTPYYEELGTALRDHVPPGRRVSTTERFSTCLVYYAQREIRGDLGDKDLEGFLAGGGAPALPSAGWFAVVEPSIDPPHARDQELLLFLRRHWQPEEIALPKSGATLLLFDLSRTAGPWTNPGVDPHH